MKTLLVSLACLPFAAFAQEFRGTISGTVSDSQVSLIPKVRVVATELATQTESGTLSDSSGKYTIPFLAPGIYEIRAEAPGFNRFKRESFALGASARPVLDIRLEVGDLRQTV